MEQSFTLTAFPKQEKFVQDFFNPIYSRMLFGGAIRGGKTFIIIILLLMLCKMWPRSRHVIIRRDLPTIKRNVIPVFDKVCPSKFLMSMNRTEMVAKMRNGSEIIFMPESLQDDPELNRFHGLEGNTFAFEEMNECASKTFYKAIERAGTWLNPQWATPCPSKIIGTCNPDQGWVKDLFYTPWSLGQLKEPYYYLPSKIFDNPHIPQWYIDGLKDMPPELYKVFVEGSWDANDHVHQLVPWASIEACRTLLLSDDHTRSIGADVGRKGVDPSVVIVLDGLNVLDISTLATSKTTETTDLIRAKMKEYNVSADHVCVDSVGVGGGVVDELAKEEQHCIPFVGGAVQEVIGFGGMAFHLSELSEGTHFTFKNWKAFGYYVAADYLKRRLVGNFTNELLKSDASSVYSFYKHDKVFQVEEKDQIKKRLGRSPDYWEAFVYACWAYHSGKMMEQFNPLFTGAKAA